MRLRIPLLDGTPSRLRMLCNQVRNICALTPDMCVASDDMHAAVDASTRALNAGVQCRLEARFRETERGRGMWQAKRTRSRKCSWSGATCIPVSTWNLPQSSCLLFQLAVRLPCLEHPPLSLTLQFRVRIRSSYSSPLSSVEHRVPRVRSRAIRSMRRTHEQAESRDWKTEQVHILVDCSYDALMSEDERQGLCRQLHCCVRCASPVCVF